MSKAMERIRDAQAWFREVEGTPLEPVAYACIEDAVAAAQLPLPPADEPRCEPGYCAAADELDAIQPQARSR